MVAMRTLESAVLSCKSGARHKQEEWVAIECIEANTAVVYPQGVCESERVSEDEEVRALYP